MEPSAERPAEHIREILTHLAEMEAELAKLSERVKRTQQLLREGGILKSFSVPDDLENRPHLGLLA